MTDIARWTEARDMLKVDEVHVWRAALEQPAGIFTRLQTALSADELARAERFRFPADRHHFIVARAFLRSLLGYYLGRSAAAIRFRYGPVGKPALADAAGDGDLQFSLSHSNGIALYAFARARRIGVDVEWINPHPIDARIAERYFSPEENAMLGALPAAERPAAFFRAWTRREAYLKAWGEGLSRLHASPRIRLDGSVPRSLAHLGEDRSLELHCTVQALDPRPGYVGALVVEGDGWRLIDRHWAGDHL